MTIAPVASTTGFVLGPLSAALASAPWEAVCMIAMAGLLSTAWLQAREQRFQHDERVRAMSVARREAAVIDALNDRRRHSRHPSTSDNQTDVSGGSRGRLAS